MPPAAIGTGFFFATSIGPPDDGGGGGGGAHRLRARRHHRAAILGLGRLARRRELRRVLGRGRDLRLGALDDVRAAREPGRRGHAGRRAVGAAGLGLAGS